MVKQTANTNRQIKVIAVLHRTGFTLIELAVVMAIISLLASLVAAGVMSARETARRMECSSHLKQIGIALHEYHATHGVLPCSGVLGLRFLSPHLDGRAGNWDLYGAPDPCLVGACPEAGDWMRPRVYLCPSDPLVRRTRRSASYAFSSGISDIPGYPGGISDGIGFADGSDSRAGMALAFRDLTDGLSHTACASEQLIPHYRLATSDAEYLAALSPLSPASDPLRYTWTISATFTLPSQLPLLFQACDATSSVTNHSAGNPFNVRNSAYNHVRTPNTRSCFNPAMTAVFLVEPISPPTSLHRSGVNLLLCDGSVRFISNSIDLAVWHAIGTRNGNEAISNF